MDVATSTRERVRTMLAAGLTPRQVANALNMTTQNVYKHKKAIEREAEAEEAAS